MSTKGKIAAKAQQTRKRTKILSSKSILKICAIYILLFFEYMYLNSLFGMFSFTSVQNVHKMYDVYTPVPVFAVNIGRMGFSVIC